MLTPIITNKIKTTV